VSDTPFPRSYWVLPGRLLAGEYPLPRDPEATVVPLQRLLAAGIDCFVDLTAADENAPYQPLLPAGVRYLRFAIPDHRVPRKPALMREIQATLAEQLAAGRRVYVHCRAGIGRTGTAIGCFLVEQGLTGESALIELNRLWQQNELASIWRDVPETDDQTTYVKEWPRYRRAPASGDGEDETGLRAVGSLRERFQGAMLGLAVGDALSAATQFRRPGSFGAVGDLLGGGPLDLPRGAWSDDTAMALCLAESLVARDQFDAADALRRLHRWQSEGHLSATGQCLGITSSTARALATSQWRRQAFAGSHDPNRLDPEPLSRQAPVGLHAYGEPARALQDSVDAARLTCQAPVVLDCSRLLAAMLQAALHGEARAQVARPPARFIEMRALKPQVAAIASQPAPPVFDGTHPAGATAPAALRAARWALLSTSNFRDGALAAVNLGGHSDVVGSIYGQLAGALYGVNAIPRAWRAALARGELIASLADQLLTSALVRLGGAPR
jgi:ADP-ribosyl-[dinitrogen reductase] hydrolase